MRTKVKNIINKTPHQITVGTEVFAAELPAARVAGNFTSTNVTGKYKEIRIGFTQFGLTTNLPAPEEGTCFIVSSIVKAANPNRTDLLIPIELVRDDEGKITGAKALSY